MRLHPMELKWGMTVFKSHWFNWTRFDAVRFRLGGTPLRLLFRFLARKKSFVTEAF